MKLKDFIIIGIVLILIFLWSQFLFRSEKKQNKKNLFHNSKLTSCNLEPRPILIDKPFTTPKLANYTRFVCISDTHNFHRKVILPEGDVLLFGGDISQYGSHEELSDFVEWLNTTDFSHKVVIAGNRDYPLDKERYFLIVQSEKLKMYHQHLLEPEAEITFISRSCDYLHDKEIIVNGIRIYGSPYSPYFRGGAFNVYRGKDIREKWIKIPANIDILITFVFDYY
jgi:hypothetical protein